MSSGETSFSNAFALIGDILIALAILISLGLMVGIFAGGVALGFKLVAGLAG